jgi:hypothetical protein
MKKTPVLSCLYAILALLILGPSYAQQTVFSGTAQVGDQFAGGASSVPSEQFAGGSCSVRNTSPYAGMNPLACKGVANPVDSRGQCSLAGLRLLRVVGNMCYYCQTINPPIKGIIVPLSQMATANSQGYRCGIDQANPGCYAVCQGGVTPATPTANSYLPPACQQASPPAWCPNSAGPGKPDCSAGVPGGYQPRFNPECETDAQEGNGGSGESDGKAPPFRIADGAYSVWRRQDPQNRTTPIVHRYIDPHNTIERQLTVRTNNAGETEVTANEYTNGQQVYSTYRLHQIEVLSAEAADYFDNAYKPAGAKSWTPLPQPVLVRVVKTTNPIPGLGYGYTVYIGSPLPGTPTEFWVRDQ